VNYGLHTSFLFNLLLYFCGVASNVLLIALIYFCSDFHQFSIISRMINYNITSLSPYPFFRGWFVDSFYVWITLVHSQWCQLKLLLNQFFRTLSSLVAPVCKSSLHYHYGGNKYISTVCYMIEWESIVSVS
jgi:hypothetical protein